MTIVWGAGLIVAGGAALAALGLWALTLKPRTTTTLAFAAYALGTGVFLAVAWSALAWPEVAGLPSFRHATPFLILVVLALWVALLVLVLGVPRPLRRDERRLVLRPALGGLAFVAVVVVGAVFNEGLTVVRVLNIGNWAVTFVAIMIALERFRAAVGPRADAERRHLALLAAALSLIVGEATGRILVETGRLVPLTMLTSVSTVVLLGLVVAWIRVTSTTPTPSARHARDVALVLVGAWFFGGAWQAWSAEGAPRWGSLGIATLTGGVILARGALVGNLLGAGVQLRWGISKSTVAAVFVAVFFVASEGAQILFEQGNEWVGLFAAGALVFAIAPLQRVAERLAEKAVPVTQPAPTTEHGIKDRLDAYRLAVAAALRDDGGLTPREETHLADLAQRLGVGAGDALRLRREIETEFTTNRRGDS